MYLVVWLVINLTPLRQVFQLFHTICQKENCRSHMGATRLKVLQILAIQYRIFLKVIFILVRVLQICVTVLQILLHSFALYDHIVIFNNKAIVLDVMYISHLTHTLW